MKKIKIKKKGRYSLQDWQETPGFITKEHEIHEMKIKILGYFPYSTARVDGNSVHLPRAFFKEFEKIVQRLHIADNKAVYVCEDLERFGTDNFIIMLKDCFVTIGKWEEITDY
jgi:hypothetical protein